MAITLNFTSPGNPPNNIVGFNIERSVRPASGSIPLSTDVDNILKIVNVTFSGTPPADNALLGDQMHINGLLYNIIANNSASISFAPDVDLSTITSFPASFIIINDLAGFSTFEIIGSVTPTLPFASTLVQQYSDTTGTMFDYYQIKSVDSGDSVSVSPLTPPFRPGQVTNLAIDEKRLHPQDTLKGAIGGSVTFEITCMLGGRRQDPANNYAQAKLYCPSYIAPNGVMTLIGEVDMARVGIGQYRGTWNIPHHLPENYGGFNVYPSDDYIVSYQASFRGILTGGTLALNEFASEFFTIVASDAPVFGRFPACATIEDLRQTYFEIDAYLPTVLKNSDVEGRNAILQYHLERASDKLREELNMHQVRSNSSDRQEYVCTRAVYTIMMAARGQNQSAVCVEFLNMWKDRAEYILAQMKREGVAQGMPLGRG